MIDDAAEAASFISGYIVQGVMNERGNLGMQGSIGRRMFALPAASVCLKPRSGSSSSLTHPVSACVAAVTIDRSMVIPASELAGEPEGKGGP